MCGPGLPFECADDFQHGFEFFEFEGRKFIVQTAADQVAPPPRSHRVRRLLPSCLFSREPSRRGGIEGEETQNQGKELNEKSREMNSTASTRGQMRRHRHKWRAAVHQGKSVIQPSEPAPPPPAINCQQLRSISSRCKVAGARPLVLQGKKKQSKACRTGREVDQIVKGGGRGKCTSTRRLLEMPRFRQTPGVHPRELSNVPRLPTAQLLRSDACQALGNFFFAAGLGAAKGQGRLHGVDVDGRRRCGVACVGFRGASRPRQIDGAAVSRLVD
eukprot:GHVT01015761.1.p1 GENE.GHVT01015761.1~~GHVT01015761.1.p1  ORF type:complete len:273 (-),score=42.89 GHVT01015761.1:357-1175(-)